jgi:hypothetical protein
MKFLCTLLLAFVAALIPASAQEDPGKEVIGQVRAKVYFATNGDPSLAGPKAKAVNEKTVNRLRKEDRLRFTNYRLLGTDKKPLFRSYENWAQPLGTTNELMLRFEAQSNLEKKLRRLDLELWISRKKILKTDAVLSDSKPLLVLGPEWRGGRLIISVELDPIDNDGSH